MNLLRLSRLIPFALIFGASAALAGSVTAKVDKLLAGPEYAQRLFISVSGTSGRPFCATNPTWTFVLDSSAPNAKVWVAMLQVAYASGKTVYIEGFNTCALWQNSEDVRYLWLE